MSCAYNEGFKARLRGDEASANPYPQDFEKLCKSWLKGWKDQDKHLNDRDKALYSIGWFGKPARGYQSDTDHGD